MSDYDYGWDGAEWIGLGSKERSDPPNAWFCFRREFELEEIPEKAHVSIAADSKYWLWINGTPAVFEGGLKRGPSPDDTYCDRVDLGGRLRTGRNCVAVLLWYFGKEGFSHKNSGKAGLFFHADLDGSILRSGGAWRVMEHPAYSTAEGEAPNFRLPESNVLFDAREDMPDWFMPGYEDAMWEDAEEYGEPPTEPWNDLVERPIPLWKDSGHREYLRIQEAPGADGNGHRCREGCRIYRAKLPYDAQITPYLRVRGPAGRRIVIKTDTYMVGETPAIRSEYITREGEQEYEALGWISGHEVLYEIPVEVEVISLLYRETGYDLEFAGNFACDDGFFNSLWVKSQRTLYVCMRDTYMDCPDRERAQWWGDAVNELGMAFYAFGKQAHALARKGILELVGWRRDDDSLFAPIPAGNYDRELPMQMLASVGWYGFWTYYLYSGDQDILEHVYPAVRDYLALWELDGDGHVVERPGEWTWGDWGRDKDMTLLYNAWYYLALKGQRAMCEVIGEQIDLPEIEERMQTIQGAFDRDFWTGSEYRSPGYADATDDRAQALAVVAGLAGTERYPALREVFAREEHASPYMEKYVLEALYLMGYPEDALDRMRRRYADMVASPYSTLFEGWASGKEKHGSGSSNHAWSGGPLTVLSGYAAGIMPELPGFESFRVLPAMASLTDIATTVSAFRGEIELILTRRDNLMMIDIVVPEGSGGTIGVPKFDGLRRIELNEMEFWIEGRPMAQDTGDDDLPQCRYEGETDSYVLFTVPQGNWVFAAYAGDS